MLFTYNYTVRLSDTDAAGVVYFANVLVMCHQAYEESLAVTGVNLKEFTSNSSTAVPIVHAEVDFFRPMFCGNQLLIHLLPEQLSDTEFEVNYQIVAVSFPEKPLAKATTRHVCINPASRKRTHLPEVIIQWLHYGCSDSDLSALKA
ncbi:MAG: acyl-CoA thioesterase [Symploca sp. SIO3C6]|uniref:1,4-dihydroxy-2-naphthoyl-CoA hydrolase n=1 Tax=Symploca sp. SIO1C4 TaxID=2607765 RepID=A0A6B3NK98_9CYAN|nr:acyl-CoA thioesterase [Symploca sp. SIO3C6]NER29648.1 acyl-CoA thioesterase [Symploca sp. SIO1C4]NET03687.1 acyl-CoA thioesterase [Symploca sp. SIO2B6]